MTRISKKQLMNWGLFIAALSAGLICRWLNTDRHLAVATALGLAQTIIYTGLAVLWGGSVGHRIVQPQIRRLLMAVSVLLFLWFLDRGVKYYVLDILRLHMDVSVVRRYLWYGYYIPMLLLPAVLLLIACSLGRSEDDPLPKKVTVPLFAVTLFFLAAVFTNDLHQLIFEFPPDAVVFGDVQYRYGWLYYPLFAWMAGSAAAAVVMMVSKCRLPGSKIVLWLPIIPVAVDAVYTVLYITGNVSFFDDVVVVMGFSVVMVMEMSIAVGLIPSNTHYAELLRASDLPLLITDGTLMPVFTSKTATMVDKELLRETARKGSVTEGGVRISAYPITGGHAFWQEDITELLEVTEELEEFHRELETQYYIAQESYQTSHRSQTLVEKNRLYNLMQGETEEKVRAVEELTNRFSQTKDEAEIRSLTARIAVLCAYLKRRNNLLFIREGSGTINGVELSYCIRESLRDLELTGTEVNMVSELRRPMSFENITKLYDVFETAIEKALHTTKELYVTMFEQGDMVILRMNMVCDADMAELAQIGFTVDLEGEGEWLLQYEVKEGCNPA